MHILEYNSVTSRLILVVILLAVNVLRTTDAQGQDYAMYVWSDGKICYTPKVKAKALGSCIRIYLTFFLLLFFYQRTAFNADAAYCNGVYPVKSENSSQCFNHSWESSAARSHLWASCTVPGRLVGRIFLSDVKNRIQYGGFVDESGTCDIDLITTLEEAHSFGVEVYALFAVNNEAFGEKDLVGYVNDFNVNCGTPTGKFDGVSVNNEYFTSIKDCTAENEAAQLKVLDDLKATKDKASPLPLHFSVSWNWDCCSCSSSSYSRRELTWNGSTKSAVEHMIDIVDSVDIQVA